MSPIPTSKYHSVVAQIVELLKRRNIWFETFEHEPVRTSEEAAKVRHGYSLQQGAKAILLRVKISTTEKKFVMLVLPGDARFDSGKVKNLLKPKDIRFATEEEVIAATGGVLPGGVPPFGNLFGIETIADPKILEQEKIVFNAGDRSFSIAMKSADYIFIVNPRVAVVISK